jgi:deoxyhypusine synthase
MYKMLLSGVLEEYYEIDLKTAGCMQLRKNYYCTRLEDSTMGNIFASYVIKGDLKLLR